MPVTVSPQQFRMVDYDAATIAELTAAVAEQAGLADQAITVTVDETTQTSRTRVVGLDPIALEVEGGAFEDLRHLRRLSPERVVDSVGLLLFRAADRLDPAFGAPALGEEVLLRHRVAWDAYALGRLARHGHRAQRQRRLFHFRNRHGFTDAADAAFDRVWAAEGLTWALLTALSDTAAAAPPDSDL